MASTAHDPSRSQDVLFREEQSFRMGGIGILLLLQFIVFGAIFGWGFYQQVVLGRPFGNQPLSDAGLIAVFALAMAVSIGLFALFFVARLITEVTRVEVRVRYVPFHRKPRTFPLSEIATAAARQYRPIVEYGGWGIRGSFGRGIAYNVSGNEGVQLVMKSGRRVLIGSQQARRLADAIERARENL